jgi:hypothetical protein
MKKILMLIYCSICSILIFSCHKDTKVVPADYYFRASQNGADWAAPASTDYIAGDSLHLIAVKPTNGEQIFINIKFNGIGMYPLTGRQAAYFTASSMDAPTTRYKLDFTKPSFLNVKSYSTQTHVISGRFELHVLKDSNNPNEYVPIDFTGGLFRVKLPN